MHKMLFCAGERYNIEIFFIGGIRVCTPGRQSHAAEAAAAFTPGDG